MSLVLGSNFIFSRKVDDAWLPYACSRSLNLNITTESIETSGPGNGLFATYAPTKNSWNASADGIVSLVDAGLLTLPALQASQLAQEVFQVQFQRTDQAGNVFTNLGYVFITGSQESGTYDGVDIFSISLQGSGPLLQIQEYVYVGIAIETTFVASELINVTVVSVKRGDTYYHVVDTPFPVGTEVRYTAGTGTFEFPTSFTPGEIAIVMYY